MGLMAHILQIWYSIGNSSYDDSEISLEFGKASIAATYLRNVINEDSNLFQSMILFVGMQEYMCQAHLIYQKFLLNPKGPLYGKRMT